MSRSKNTAPAAPASDATPTYRVTGVYRAVQFTDDHGNVDAVNAILEATEAHARASVDYRHGVGQLRVPLRESDGRALFASLGDWVVAEIGGRGIVLVLDDTRFRDGFEAVVEDSSAPQGGA